MPMVTRPHEMDGNSIQGRRSFRAVPDFKRAKSNGNGNGHHARNNNGNNTRTAPPESTNAENFYYLKQMAAKTPMVVVLQDGEEIRGWIEWYDRNCLKVNRDGAPNLLIQKHCIKYVYKQDELA